MKTMTRLALLLVAVAALGAGLAACNSGQKARQAATVTIDAVDAGVEKDVRKGVSLIALEDDSFDADLALINVESFFAATSSRDRWQISEALVRWPTMRDYAVRGYDIEIRNGTLGSLVAASLIERLNQFEEAIQAVADGATPAG